MSKINPVLSESDAKIRKQWLIAHVVRTIVIPMVWCVLCLFEPGQESPTYIISSMAIMSLIGFCLPYYFAYKKYGIWMLTFWLVSMPIKLLTHIFKELLSNPDVLTYVSICVESPLCIWWVLTASKLLQVNRAIRYGNKPVDPAYVQASLEIENAQSLADLDVKFYALMEKVPMFKSRLADEYIAKKARLEKVASESVVLS